MNDKGNFAAAELLQRGAGGAGARCWGIGTQKTLASINNLGNLLEDTGDLAAAEPLLREELKVQHETLGSRHPDTLFSINNLSKLLKYKVTSSPLSCCTVRR